MQHRLGVNNLTIRQALGLVVSGESPVRVLLSPSSMHTPTRDTHYAVRHPAPDEPTHLSTSVGRGNHLTSQISCLLNARSQKRKVCDKVYQLRTIEIARRLARGRWQLGGRGYSLQSAGNRIAGLRARVHVVAVSGPGRRTAAD